MYLSTLTYLKRSPVFNLDMLRNRYRYRKALRCTFFGERKNSCSSKFVQLLLLNRVKARWSENRAAQGFHYINSFTSNIFGPNSKTCTWEVHATWDRVSRGLTDIFFFWLSRYVYGNMTENFPLGTLDSVLFTLVILSTAGAGIFQGWVESSNNLSPGGLALPKGRGAFVDVLYRITITTCLPLILGKEFSNLWFNEKNLISNTQYGSHNFEIK